MPNRLNRMGEQFKNALMKLVSRKKPIASPETTGMKPFWSESVLNGMTPQKLASIISQANNGNADALLTLAEEIEERDPHYAAVLGSRKRAVVGLPRAVEAASESAQDKMLADEVRKLIKAPIFTNLLENLLDALGKPYSVCEILVDTRHTPWFPNEYAHRDARWFKFDPDNGRELRVKSQEHKEGLKIEPGAFICHVPQMKSGLPIRGGLARVVAFALLCKMYAQKDWVAFVEVFGMPLRLGKYNSQSASDADKRALRHAVASLGSDASAIMPESMQIEFIQTGNVSGASELFRSMCEYFDKQVSKAVLGQTMTTDDGASLSQAKVHDDVRDDILRADARQLSDTINRDLIKPFIIWNWGEQESYPSFELQVEDAEDLDSLSGQIEKLVNAGTAIPQSYIYDKWNIPEPQAGEKLLGKAESPDEANALALNQRQKLSQSTLKRVLALIDEEDFEAISKPLIEPILQTADENPELILQRLGELYPQLDADALHERLARVMFVAGAVARLELQGA